MEISYAVFCLKKKNKDNRLEIFLLLLQAAPDGLAAGRVSEELDLAPNTLTFHFDRLRGAGLVTVRRDGRSMIYAARYETMNSLLAFLTENCCQGLSASSVAAACAAVECKPAKPTRKKERVS